MRISKNWWKKIYNKEYLSIYVDIDAPDVNARQVSFVLKQAKPPKKAKILELACGYGRHAIEFARRGDEVTGLDYSRHFIELARRAAEEQEIKVKFRCGDMRRMSSLRSYDLVTCLFTSFGYFDDEQDHSRVFQRISRSLKPNGSFILDLTNTIDLVARLAKEGSINKKTGLLTSMESARLSNGLHVTSKLTFDPKTIRRTLVRRWEKMGKKHSYAASVRLFMLPEIQHLLEENGLAYQNIWGDYDGSSFSYTSPRMIILARKK